MDLKGYVEGELKALAEKELKKRNGLLRTDVRRMERLASAKRFLELKEAYEETISEFEESQKKEKA